MHRPPSSPAPASSPVHLALERITPGGTEGGEDAPEGWIVLLHGIYGAGRNWRSVARRLVAEREGWGAGLVDLRGHGDSPVGEPPHTVEAAARDLLHTVRREGLDLRAVLGHSFGGKVALEYGRLAAEFPSQDDAVPEQIWVVDSTPAPRDPAGDAWRMLEVLRRHPGPFDDRSGGLEALEGEGYPGPVARWMVTNLEEDEGGWRWRLELDQMEALLRDFFRRDLWPVLESPPGDLRIHLVRASRSDVLEEASAVRVEAAVKANGRVRLHEVEGGHWLNVDNPDALVELLATRLP